MSRWILGVLAVALVSCSGSDADTKPSPVTVSCPAGTRHFALTLTSTAGQLAAIESNDVKFSRSSGGEILGVTGTDQHGATFWLVRDGDYSDGSLGTVQTFDASSYPYLPHLMLGSQGYYATQGSWTVTAVPASGGWFTGTLSAQSVVDEMQENCWDSTSCQFIAGATVNACFSADQAQ